MAAVILDQSVTVILWQSTRLQMSIILIHMMMTLRVNPNAVDEKEIVLRWIIAAHELEFCNEAVITLRIAETLDRGVKYGHRSRNSR